jgi:hypothetical protein
MDGGRPRHCGRASVVDEGRPHYCGRRPAVDGGRPRCCGHGSAVDGGRPHCCGHGSAVDGGCPHNCGRRPAVDGGRPHYCGDLLSTAGLNLLVSSLKMIELERLSALVRVSTHQFPSPRVPAGHCRTEKGAEAGDPSGKKTAPKSRLVRGDTHQGTRRSLPKAG